MDLIKLLVGIREGHPWVLWGMKMYYKLWTSHIIESPTKPVLQTDLNTESLKFYTQI